MQLNKTFKGKIWHKRISRFKMTFQAHRWYKWTRQFSMTFKAQADHTVQYMYYFPDPEIM